MKRHLLLLVLGWLLLLQLHSETSPSVPRVAGTPLSKEKVSNAVEMLFRWQGVKVVQAGDYLVKLVQE